MAVDEWVTLIRVQIKQEPSSNIVRLNCKVDKSTKNYNVETKSVGLFWPSFPYDTISKITIRTNSISLTQI